MNTEKLRKASEKTFLVCGHNEKWKSVDDDVREFASFRDCQDRKALGEKRVSKDSQDQKDCPDQGLKRENPDLPVHSDPKETE